MSPLRFARACARSPLPWGRDLRYRPEWSFRGVRRIGSPLHERKPVTDLDSVAAELAAARKQLQFALILAAGYVEAAAAEGDATAAALNRLLCDAFDRVAVSNILGTTVMEENRG